MTTQKRGDGVAIMGATATGKSHVALQMASEFNGEIISMDSRQIYRSLEIGTAKPTTDERRRVPHHLVDSLAPTETTSAGQHLRAVEAALGNVVAAAHVPFLVGGTGLYFRVLIEGLIEVDIPAEELRQIRQDLSGQSNEALYETLCECDPDRAEMLSPNDRVRISRALEIFFHTGQPYSLLQSRQKKEPRWSGLKIVLTMPRDQLRDRIEARTKEMFRNGWIQEVESLLDSGLMADAPAMTSLGYGVIAQAVLEARDVESVVDHVVLQTQKYAKRQETFFRSIENAHWIDVTQASAVDEIRQLIKVFLEP